VKGEYPTEAQAIRLTARKLAEDCFEEVERRFAVGTTFEQAKREVLEQRVPGFVSEHGPDIADEVIRLVMPLQESSTSPGSRRRHRERRWRILTTIRAAAGGNPPTHLQHLLFRWFGREPR